ncbi:PNK3P-domain-containing protein [Guyanagaster necrorhizus]|uniref:PNK3P-domain-containing protein n=1 Tax=Guyanagaster necrorhizus TaxID=856835 RepID=A0A9P7W5B6_9AGAR|nr:PNK3P-domain-containing protein [Guyanagaster necrorhizus MCA 3950]KAG7452953.1 PNK3P-domain-containing protein [Guyanagaster necrorhizus MCA 3950]
MPPSTSSSLLSSKKRSAPDSDAGNAKKVVKVHPFFTKDRSSDASTISKPDSMFHWLKPLGSRGTCLHAINLAPKSFAKVATFDLDGTLIKSSFGKGSKREKGNPTHFEWWDGTVPKVLKRLHQDGFSIIIISNQALKGAALATWKQKIPSIAAALSEVPFRMLAATAKDEYRKPMPGMWNELTGIFEAEGVFIDKESSFFVGDAAGRKWKGSQKDFSCTDRKWSLNIDLPFYTPEEYFLGQPVHTNFTLDGFDVSSLPTLPSVLPTSSPILPDPPLQELVLFVGYPCLGKTSFFRRYFEPAGYIHTNQDTLGSRPKCIAAVKAALDEGKSCVVDNTNRDVKTRKYYIDIAKAARIPVRCFLFTGSVQLAWHNNLYRAYNLPPSVKARDEPREVLPYLALTSFHDKYEVPDKEEGFVEIKTVNWRFEGTHEEEKYWKMWLQV